MSALQWRGMVRWQHATAPNDDQYDHLVSALPGYGTAEYDSGRQTLTARMTVEATTLRAAADDTLRAARAAYTAAFGAACDPLEARILTDDAWVRELEHPPQIDVAGHTEIAEILGVTKTRVGQLAEQHPDFPAPIGVLKAGRIYTRASIEAFARSDWRRKPGPKPRQPAPEDLGSGPVTM